MIGLRMIWDKLIHHFFKMDHCGPPLNDEDHHHEHCPYPQRHECPGDCGHQEFQLSDGIDVHLGPGDEINRNISLNHNPYNKCCTLSGIVKDKDGCPIENALVQVFDTKHQPVTHGFTNEEGQYLFCLEHGQYILKAVR